MEAHVNIEEAEVAIAAVTRAWPDLTYLGFKHVGANDFSEERAEIFTDYAREEFMRAMTWLSLVPKRKTFHPYESSYGIKEAAETWTGDYIANGVFIAAAIHLGFRVARMPQGPNAEMGISGASKWPKAA